MTNRAAVGAITLATALAVLPATHADPAAAVVAESHTDDTAAALERARAALDQARTAERTAQLEAQAASEAAVAARHRSAIAGERAARADRERAAAEDLAEQARADMGRLAAHAYMRNPALEQISQMISSPTFNTLARRAESFDLLLTAQSVLAYRVQAALADATAAAEHAAAQSVQANADQQAAEEAEAAADAALTAAATATVAATHALTEAQAAHDRASEQTPPATERASAVGDRLGLIHPARAPITSPYGMRVHPVTGVYKLHSGTDFGASCGAGVVAAAVGTVEETGYAGAYGNRITINHGTIAGTDVMTTYNHLSKIDVAPGQTVAAGDRIGRVGTTGSSTGCHLHFEVLIDGQFTDPMPHLP